MIKLLFRHRKCLRRDKNGQIMDFESVFKFLLGVCVVGTVVCEVLMVFIVFRELGKDIDDDIRKFEKYLDDRGDNDDYFPW